MKPSKQAGTNRTHGKSLPQKITFISLHLMVVLTCAWLIYFNGWEIIGKLFNQEWKLADPGRASFLFICAVVYWLRHVVTLFYLLARKVDWSEVFGLIVFFAIFEIGLVLLGGGAFRNFVIAPHWIDVIAVVLLFVGSYFNSFSEIQRKWWKKNPENKGHCYTIGLFKYSMHINFFGDIVLFSGWVLLTNNIWAFGLPLLMLIMFTFLHIPALDAYLLQRYGKEFEDYAQKTKKLIPFVY